ncbi:MAG: nitroreductase family protein [Methanofollis liminatans]|jgi:nitroreductase|uniref:Nitroreductase n=1 Tax=Methanofollis liminatans DSM 4140 TaxID=28892 RepID=J1L5I6_9EURY|nr:nitroreductase family protein [Methanofollis liminatans]EJG08060.1 nitroreductase [Methanofollis liminatans DSM 4140]MDD3111787.1 nitroreductase family protein [Methanofollis liminatans]
MSTDTIEAIMTRRSVRAYTAEPIGDEEIESLLRAAMQAPSAVNEQPWEFVVIRDRALLDQVPAFSPYASMAKKAPLGILVCADTRRLAIEGFWPQDCAAATENLLLAAHVLGLGAVWTGAYPMKDRVDGFARLCRLPEGVVPFCFVVVGRPAHRTAPANRFLPARVHENLW